MTVEGGSAGPRGTSRPLMRTAECKDCAREVRAGKRELGTQFFQYPESWALGQLERGGSRTDRCREHREKHRRNTAGLAVAYIDLETVGEVADRENPSGPLGGLGPLPDVHKSPTPPASTSANSASGWTKATSGRCWTASPTPSAGC